VSALTRYSSDAGRVRRVLHRSDSLATNGERKISAVHDHSVLNLAVFVLRKHMPRYELVSIRVRTLGNNSVCLVSVEARKRRQVVFRRRIQVDGPLPAESFFDTLGYCLAVLLEFRSVFRGLSPDLIRTLVGAGDRQAQHEAEEGEKKYPDMHVIRML